MPPPPVHPSPSWWVRAALAPWQGKAALLAVAGVAYVSAFLWLGPEEGTALRPVNLLFVMLGGLLFGLRGGLAVAAGAVAVNVALYLVGGVLAPTPSVLAGNLLASAAGAGVAAGVGRVRDLTLALREEVRRREEAERRKAELTSLLVHDFKNPLAAIAGYARLLLMEARQEPDSGREHPARRIEAAAEYMHRMVMSLLDISRAEEGWLTPQLAPLHPATLVEEVAEAWRPQLSGRSQRLEVSLPSGPLSEAVADGDLVRRVLLNLLDNAARYTPRGGTVVLEAAGAGDWLELVVRDQGPGIPAGFEERIFEKYTRLERDAPVAAQFSRGLGLHFCKLATEAHGGSIRVEPNPGGGSLFRVRLPLRPAPL